MYFAPARPAKPRLILVPLLLLLGGAPLLHGQDKQDSPSNQAALALYADAANFQTNGAFDLAIKSWREFLEKFPQHKLTPKVAHYLGVCYMQSDPPELLDAAKAFGLALRTEKYELREESLSNRGWCFYAIAVAGEKPDKRLLTESLKTYKQLLKDYPRSQYRGRAYFYSGEAAYSMGDAQQAIKNYSKLLQMDGAEKSPFHCDALYARGFAQEEIEEYDAAAKSYKQLLKSCVQTDFVVDVQLRLGDIRLRNKKYEQAIELFQKVIDDATGLAGDEDRAHALFRQGLCYAKLNQPDKAAQRYERLVEKSPHSQYAPAARLAAAQTRYQTGDRSAAAKGFRQVLSGEDPAAATEAAHWLARIELSKATQAPDDSPEMEAAAEAAYQVAAKRIAAGAQGQYAVTLKLDAAEALSFQKNKLAEAMAAFEEVANEHPTSDLAPRAIYNAAFTALQLGDHQRAIRLADDFQRRFTNNPLIPDVAFIGAEAKMLSGNLNEAAQRYQKLIAEPKYQDNRERSQWILRGATALQAAEKPAEAAALIGAQIDTIEKPSERAEAFLLAGQAQLKMGEAEAAAQSFQASQQADPQGARAREALLLAGQAQRQAGDLKAAIGIWRKLVSSGPQTRTADQARYKLAQLASDAGEHAGAIKRFDSIIASGRDPELIPFALYGKGWAEMTTGDFKTAEKTLAKTIQEYPQHSILDDALLAHGMTLRHLKKYAPAAKDLTRFLDTNPTGMLLGHGLYELALVRQKQNQPDRAAARLSELISAVADYPDMDKVIYELGWSLKQAGKEDAAIEQFQTLISKYPDNPLVPEAAYYVGQQQYTEGQWNAAAKSFEIAANPDAAGDAMSEELLEKSLYRLGWSYFKAKDYPAAEAAFSRQYREAENGPLFLDAMMMVGESRFKQDKFQSALRAYDMARKKIEADDDSAKTLRDESERQVRELTLLHGGQSAAQLKDWDAAIRWYDELRQRFPATKYLPQVFYETGFAQQQAGNEEQALKLYAQVADNYRNELGARARFMMGEIHFANKSFAQAMPEFQQVMYGYGADTAPPEIQNWQAKSGFEAGRCAESLIDVARTDSARSKARKFAVKFYKYVVDKHPDHELAGKAQERLNVVSQP